MHRATASVFTSQTISSQIKARPCQWIKSMTTGNETARYNYLSMLGKMVGWVCDFIFVCKLCCHNCQNFSISSKLEIFFKHLNTFTINLSSSNMESRGIYCVCIHIGRLIFKLRIPQKVKRGIGFYDMWYGLCNVNKHEYVNTSKRFRHCRPSVR